MRISYIFLLTLCLLLVSCIDPYPVVNDNDLRLLTVDGLISTSPGPHQIRLTISNNYNNQSDGNTIPMTGAQVAIHDEFDNIINLQEEIIPSVTYFDSRINSWITRAVNRRTGIYQTPSEFAANIGTRYTLKIITPDGKSYSSLPEVAHPVAPIEKVSIRPYKFPSANPLIFRSGLYLDVTFTDHASEKNYYMWRPSNAWGILKSFPELYSVRGCPSCSAPKSCCSSCFLEETRLSGLFEIQNDFLFDGILTTMPTLFIQDDGFRFMERYRIQINQHAISEEGYNFLYSIKSQMKIQGSVFDPLPSTIRGNIISQDNPQEQVLGYFFVTDVSSKMVYINRSDIPSEFLQPMAVIEDDCREFFGFTGSFLRTERVNTIPPEDWEFN